MLRIFHRASACVIASFAAIHLYNHLLAIQNVAAHIQFMESFRQIYRNTVVETVLLACVAYQVSSGIYLLWHRWGQRRGFFERLQAMSGGYLAYALLAHTVSVVLLGRTVLRVDTNFYFAAAGMHVTPYQLYFVPYYFLFVVALFGHVACAVHWLTREQLRESSRNYLGYAVLAVGVVVAALIVAALAGAFYDISIPQVYRATYE